jgi:hypothetical protein
MTRGAALRALLIQWLSCALAVSIVVVFQSMFGKYGDDSGMAWAWLAGVFVPPLAILLTATLTESTINWHEAKASRFKFWLAFALGSICFVAVIAVVFVEPFVDAWPLLLFGKMDLVLSVWQGFALAAIGAVIFEGR